jgi:hypothetical protein
MQQEFEKVYNDIMEAHTKMEVLFEEKVTNISDPIKGFHACISDLEVRMTPSNPSNEREKRE